MNGRLCLRFRLFEFIFWRWQQLRWVLRQHRAADAFRLARSARAHYESSGSPAFIIS
jgi:hypothetical protein